MYGSVMVNGHTVNGKGMSIQESIPVPWMVYLCALNCACTHQCTILDLITHLLNARLP